MVSEVFLKSIMVKFKQRERQDTRELLASMKEINAGDKHADNGMCGVF